MTTTTTSSTTVHATIDDSDICVTVPYVLKEHLGGLGAKWEPLERQFRLPLTWANCLALRTEFGPAMTLSPGLTEWAFEYRKHTQTLKDQRDNHGRAVTLAGDDRPGFDGLFQHQRSGIDLILRSRDLNQWQERDGARYLVLDQMGTGKGRLALGALALLGDTDPALIVCPKSMIRTWRDEARRFFPDADIREVQGTAVQRRKLLAPGARLYITSYESMRAHSRILGYGGAAALTEEQKQPKEIQALGIQAMIVDEVHRCMDPRTLQTRAVWSVADHAKHVIAMTGTPIQESPEDLWSVLRMLDRHTFPTMTRFRNRYLDMVINPYGLMDVRGLQERTRTEFFDLLHTMSRRAEVSQVLSYLPPRMHEIRWVELPAPMRRAYREMATDYMTRAASGDITADNAMVVAGRLLQLANAPLEILPPVKPGDEDRVRMVGPSPKVGAFMADIAAGDFKGQSVVVFSDSRQLLDLCAEAMADANLDFVSITGSTPVDERNSAIERFQRGDVPFFLITRAGEAGITLTKASTMVRLTRAWSFITHEQSAARIYRAGSEQHDRVTYIDYVSENTLEEGQIARLNGKREKATAILSPAELKELLQ